MKNLRNNRKKIIILILIFIIILLFTYKIAKVKNSNFQEDFLFFKLLGGRSIENTENIKQNNIDSKNLGKIKVFKNQKTYQKVNLFQTVDLKTLVNEKIAPGSKGYFYIYLISNSDLEYEIEIISKNEKPKNFEFEIEEDKGKLEKNKIKKIRINWKWLYEINEEENIQDTKDGENIDKYNFEICTIGK